MRAGATATALLVWAWIASAVFDKSFAGMLVVLTAVTAIASGLVWLASLSPKVRAVTHASPRKPVARPKRRADR